MSEKFPLIKKKLTGTSRFQRAMAMKVAVNSHFDKEKIANDRSQYRFIKYRPEDYHHRDIFFERALRLVEKKATQEIYRLSLKDLLVMDYDTFTLIEDRVEKIEQVRKEEEKKLPSPPSLPNKKEI